MNIREISASIPRMISLVLFITSIQTATVFEIISGTAASLEPITDVPEAPTDLNSRSDGTVIILEWTRSDSFGRPVDHYVINRRVNGREWKELKIISSNWNRFEDRDVVPGVYYEYFIEAINENGYSMPSNTVRQSVQREEKDNGTVLIISILSGCMISSFISMIAIIFFLKRMGRRKDRLFMERREVVRRSVNGNFSHHKTGWKMMGDRNNDIIIPEKFVDKDQLDTNQGPKGFERPRELQKAPSG